LHQQHPHVCACKCKQLQLLCQQHLHATAFHGGLAAGYPAGAERAWSCMPTAHLPVLPCHVKVDRVVCHYADCD
jgi:hypothetical protein